MGFTQAQKDRAIQFYLENKRSLRATVDSLGYPSYEALRRWLLANKLSAGTWGGEQVQSFRVEKARAEARAVITEDKKAVFMAKEDDFTRSEVDEVEELKREIKRLNELNHDMALDNAILEETIKIIKKDPSVDSNRLSNKEKTIVIDALRDQVFLKELLKRMRLSKSSYYYQKAALFAGDKYKELKIRIGELFFESKERYGYRPIHALLKAEGIKVSEKIVRAIMSEENYKVKKKRTKRFSSYLGEITPAPQNLIDRDFHADAPNVKWLTDITEFSIAAGRVYLSAMVDCFEGLAISWSISNTPNAELANSMLDKAIKTLSDDESPLVHTDRGSHYRWPGWIKLMNERGLSRSMSKKGCSPDNAACEGFFGRLKNEFFYERDWDGYSIEEFIETLDDYLHWYNEVRIKKSLGWKSPAAYRKCLGAAV